MLVFGKEENLKEFWMPQKFNYPKTLILLNYIECSGTNLWMN